MRTLEGRTALISGAARGLGRAIAIRLSESGAHVVIADIDRIGSEETKQAALDVGGSASCLTMDVTDIKSVKGAVASTLTQFGERFDCLINNAGAPGGAGVLGTSDEVWEQTIAVNQIGPLNLSRAFLKAVGMRERNAPVDIVNVISTAALSVGSNEAAYDTSKAALNMLTRVMQREAMESNWSARIHGLMPGGMRTAFMSAAHLSDVTRMDTLAVADAVVFMLTLQSDIYIQNMILCSRSEQNFPV